MKPIPLNLKTLGLVAVLVGSAVVGPVEAASAVHHPIGEAGPFAYDIQENPNNLFGPLVRVQPNDVVSGGRIIGRDPDPFIRGELLRHYHSGWPD
jgi:hypothetical protein